MAAPRRVIEVSFSEKELSDLARVSRSRTEPASHVQRACILLIYREKPSFYATGRAIGVTHQTVERCLRRARKFGVMAALDDSPRPGREPTITSQARTFVVDLACRKPKDFGYPHEVWTTRLLAEHVRERAVAAGRRARRGRSPQAKKVQFLETCCITDSIESVEQPCVPSHLSLRQYVATTNSIYFVA